MLTAQPAAAQKIYPNEPLMMDPYATIYVNDGSCSAGKVLRVQGAQQEELRADERPAEHRASGSSEVAAADRAATLSLPR